EPAKRAQYRLKLESPADGSWPLKRAPGRFDRLKSHVVEVGDELRRGADVHAASRRAGEPIETAACAPQHVAGVVGVDPVDTSEIAPRVRLQVVHLSAEGVERETPAPQFEARLLWMAERAHHDFGFGERG